MEKPLVLLTGASGFIGSHLARALAPSWRLRCPVRAGSVGKVPKHPNIQTCVADMRDANALRKSCDGVSVVIHAAALLRTASPDEIEVVNVESTRVLAEEYVRNGMEQFIYLSSENALRMDLVDAYPASKRRAENIARTLAGHLILRPCFVFGSGDSHGLGRLVNLVRHYPVVPLFGGLKATVQPIYIDDFIAVMQAGIERKIQGEFTIAGSDALDLNAIARMIARSFKLRRAMLPVPRLLWQLAAAMGSHIPGCGWGPAQFANIYNAVHRDPLPAIREFGVQPRGLQEALNDWATTSCS